MKSSTRAVLFGGLVLLTGGVALHPIKGRCKPGVAERSRPVAEGGYRTFAADCFWLKTNLAWETRDPARVRRLIDFTVMADPQAPYFWLNGARILAYDFPAWQCAGEDKAPLALRARWRMLGADEALRLLERGQHWHGHSAALHLEMANICLYALGDRHRAAECYRVASEQSDAPDYAARIYTRLHEEEIAGMTLTR